MEELLSVFSNKPKFAIKGDFVDSLHSKRTVLVFLAFAVLVAIKQFDEDSGALSCWLSTSLSDEQISYVHQLCWVNSTYYFPGLEDPDDFQHERRFTIPYYQFILFILVGQAFSFYLPNLLWNYLASDSASYMSSVLDQIDLVKYWNTLVEKEKEHAEEAAKKQDKERIKKLVKRTVDESMMAFSKKSSRSEGMNDQEPLQRRQSKGSAKLSNPAFGQQRVNMLSSADLEKRGLIQAEEKDASSSGESDSELQQPPSDLMPRLEEETFSELQEALAPLSRLRMSARARRKDHIESSKARMRPRTSPYEKPLAPLLRGKIGQDEDAKEIPVSREQDSRKMLKLSRQKLRKLIRRPIDAVRNLTAFYFLYKLVNLANIVIQFVLLTFIFGNEFYTFGIQFINRVFINTEANIFSTKQFPILTFCDFFVYQNLRQIHFNTAQCLLHINVIIEKFYIVIWFWLIILFVVTFFNIISWIIEIFPSSTSFLLKYITIKEKILLQSNNSERSSVSSDDPELIGQVGRFKRDYLGRDGVLMMHMIKSISGPIWFMDILWRSWNSWKSQNGESKGQPDD